MALTPDKAKTDEICLFVAGNPGCKKNDVAKGVKAQNTSIDIRISEGWIVDVNAGVHGTYTELYVTHKWLHYVQGGR